MNYALKVILNGIFSENEKGEFRSIVIGHGFQVVSIFTMNANFIQKQNPFNLTSYFLFTSNFKLCFVELTCYNNK
jgi:hypothetical protein